jgi:hypothetical protein
MVSKYSAGEQYLGYLYQARYALLLILRSNEEAIISIESLDDVEFNDGDNVELIQLKHHSSPMNLTDRSPDLWKTIRVWSDHVNSGIVDPSKSILSIITTGTAVSNTIAYLLRPNPEIRDEVEALQRLVKAAKSSTNKLLRNAFDEFLSLEDETRSLLVSAIQVLDNSPDITDAEYEIKNEIKYAVRRENIQHLYERLEGWWFGKIIKHLRDHPHQMISKYEVHDKIRDIADQFKPDALPIDFLDAFPPDTPNPDYDSRYFVLQLKAIAIQNKRIEKAIIDYYRAFEQRSKWAREDLLIGDELKQYENKLVDEWERHFLALQDHEGFDETVEELLKQHGRSLYDWMEFDADFNIRPHVTEKYVMRGSYHILANDDNPKVWWHPKFLERLEELLHGVSR